MTDHKDLFMTVEIPKGSFNKVEYNKKNKRFELDRVLSSPMPYPEEYGVISKTLALDGDELDVICISNKPTFTGLYIPIRIVGALEMIDGGEEDHKLIAVNNVDPELDFIRTMDEIPSVRKEKIKHFFSHYKDLEKNKKDKKVVVGDFLDKEKAEKLLEDCRKLFLKSEK